MSVRRYARQDAGTGATHERWFVDVDFAHADGTRERVRRVSPVQTRRGAEEYERQVRVALLDPHQRRTKAPTFKRFVADRWWPTYPDAAGNRERTKREKEGHLRLYLHPALDELALDAITGEVIARMIAGLAERGISPKTRCNVRATLRRILASAVEWGVLEKLPDFPTVAVPAHGFDFFVHDEAERLVGVARSEEERALLLFALHTGARAGEQLAVEWRDVDLDRCTVIFRRSTTLGITGPTKTGRERTVPLSAALTSALRAIEHDRSPLVFCHGNGTAVSIGHLHERLWGACRRAGLRRIRWHDMRHSFASQLVIAGVPLVQVQQWLGHSSITMTMRYAHLAPGDGRQWIGALEGTSTATLRQQKGNTPKSR